MDPDPRALALCRLFPGNVRYRSTVGVSIYNAGVSFVPGGTGLRQSNKDSKLNSTPVLNDQAVFNVFMI